MARKVSLDRLNVLKERKDKLVSRLFMKKLELLLEKDAEVDGARVGVDAITLAAQNGHVDVVKLLLDAKARKSALTLPRVADHGARRPIGDP